MLCEYHPHRLQLSGEWVQDHAELFKCYRAQHGLVIPFPQEHRGRPFPLGKRNAALGHLPLYRRATD